MLRSRTITLRNESSRFAIDLARDTIRHISRRMRRRVLNSPYVKKSYLQDSIRLRVRKIGVHADGPRLDRVTAYLRKAERYLCRSYSITAPRTGTSGRGWDRFRSLGAVSGFDAMFDFLHNHYFPRQAWANFTLSPAKSYFFVEDIRVLGSHLSSTGLRPSLNKVAALRKWPTPVDLKGLKKFCFVLPFLSPPIPGRADLVTAMKTAMITDLEHVEGKRKRQRVVTGLAWSDVADEAFRRIKQEICDNALNGGDPKLQYHLATDASDTGVGGVLFQLPGHLPGTWAIEVPKSEWSIIMFISFHLSDAKRNYHITERDPVFSA